MGLFSATKIFGLTIRESANDGSDFTNPDADYRRLFLGEDGFLHVKDSAGTVTDAYDSGGGVTHDDEEDTLAGNFTLTNANQDYDTGLAVTVAAGTWLILWKVLHVTANQPVSMFLWLHNGTAAVDEMEARGNINGYRGEYTSFVIVSPGGSTTYTVFARADAAGQVIARNGGYPAVANRSSAIAAIKIA